MLIEKTYHFYAAHRNQMMTGKCNRLHGHEYRLTVAFDVGTREGLIGHAVTTPFETFDSKVNKLLKNYFDHRTFWDEAEAEAIPDEWKIPLPFPSSAENVAMLLYALLTQYLDFDVAYIRLQETSSSTIVYARADWNREAELFRGVKRWFDTNDYWCHLLANV